MHTEEDLLWVLLERNAEEYADVVAYRFDDHAFTWRDVRDDVNDVVAVLCGQGVRKGTSVGVMGLNSYHWVVGVFACMEIGAVAILASCSYHEEELDYFLGYGRVEYLLIGRSKDGLDYREMIEPLRGKHPLLRQVCSLDQMYLDAKAHTGICPVDLKAIRDKVSRDDTALVIFTSGTTRRPKGVMLSNRNVLRISGTIADHLELCCDDVQVVAMPFFHGSGMNACLLPALQRATQTVILPCYSSVGVMQAIQRYKCTVYNSVPSLQLIMAYNDSFGTYDLTSVRCGIWAGSAVSKEKFDFLRTRFGFMDVVLGYGQTEASTLSTMTRLEDSDRIGFSSCGKALEGVNLRIYDCKRHAPARIGEEGEIQINGYSRMQGYLDLPEEDEKRFEPDGWLKTGDCGFLDEQGNLFFVCRMDDMIVRGGENISPAEIESCISRFSDQIEIVKVVGVKSEVMNEEVAAFFTAGEPIDIEQLQRYLKKNISKYKMPVVLCQIDELPTLDNGKVDSNALKAQAVTLLK